MSEVQGCQASLLFKANITHICIYHIYVCRNILTTTVLRAVSNIINWGYVKALGRRVIELRNAKGWSQEKLANHADIPINQVGRIERGEINTTVSTIYAIAKAFKMSVAELFDFPIKEDKQSFTVKYKK